MNSKVIRSERSNSLGNKPPIYRLVEVSKLVAYFSGKSYRFFSGQKHAQMQSSIKKNAPKWLPNNYGNINNVSPTIFFSNNEIFSKQQKQQKLCATRPTRIDVDNLEQSIAPPIHRGSWLRSNGSVKTVGFEKLLGFFYGFIWWQYTTYGDFFRNSWEGLFSFNRHQIRCIFFVLSFDLWHFFWRNDATFSNGNNW